MTEATAGGFGRRARTRGTAEGAGQGGAGRRTIGRRRGAWPRAGALAASALVLAGGTALGAIRVGTDGGETLTGSHQADQLTGKGGDDLLKGLAGNDTYHFADGWGTDALEEKARYRVAGKRRPGGVDTLDFSGVSAAGGVNAMLVPEGGTSSNRVTGPAGEVLELGASRVENVVGSPGRSDVILGGAGRNTLRTGGGLDDSLFDVGGYDDGPGGNLALPASDDAYLGAGENTGMVLVQDLGGGGDVLDLRPLAWSDVWAEGSDIDANGTEESLTIAAGTGRGVVVLGQLGAFDKGMALAEGQGLIEKLVFAGATFTGGAAAARAMEASVAAAGGDRQELAAAADGLAAEARQRMAGAGPAPWEAPGTGAVDAAPDAAALAASDGDGAAGREARHARGKGNPGDDGAGGFGKRRGDGGGEAARRSGHR